MFCLPDIQLDRLLNGKNGLWPQRVPDEGVTRAAGIRTRNPRDAYLIVRREERQPQGSLRIRAAPWCQAGIEGEGQDITRIYRVEAWTGRPAVQVWMASEGLLVIKVTKVIKGYQDNVVLKGSVDPKVPLVQRV